jgi:general secretion pathway protein E
MAVEGGAVAPSGPPEPGRTGSPRPAAEAGRLGARLVASGRLKPADLDRALRLQSTQTLSELLGVILIKLGLVSERDVVEALAHQLDVPLAERASFPETPIAAGRVSARFLAGRQALPLREDADAVHLAMADPRDEFVAEALRFATGKRVVRYVAAPSEIEEAFQRLYGAPAPAAAGGDEATGEDRGFQEDVEHLKELASEAPVIKFANAVIHRAVDASASDIHIEPFESRLKVRYRVDGMLREVDSLPAQSAAAVISRIKIMADLNIAERRLPQDGRFKTRVGGREIDLRVSTVPTLYGESVVMRLLHRDDIALEFSVLGLTPAIERTLLEALAVPHGIFLVTGPTGSGKTTTLYAALRHLNTPERKVLTVEDPVEYNLEGINQIQVKPQIGLTFASALRSIVRQDPDVIMIGEMRDQETARIAVQSALTGHLVLSTVHTNDAAGSVTRLMDMGVESYLLTSTLTAVMAQRLVRTLCGQCREAYEPPAGLVARWQLERHAGPGPVRLYRPVGCPRCAGTGYAGRTAIAEIFRMSDPVRELVLARADAGRLTEAARREGMRTMLEDGIAKALAGTTSLEEVLRVTQE